MRDLAILVAVMAALIAAGHANGAPTADLIVAAAVVPAAIAVVAFYARITQGPR